jgi:hypothetical protein
MRLTLNGWQRLWLVTALLLGAATVVFAVLALPEESTVTHNLLFQAALSEEARSQIAGPDDAVGTTVRMPNGHQLALKVGVEAKRSTAVLAEYATELQRQLILKRRTFLLWLGGIWLAASMALYGIGWAIGWIRRGFASSSHAP